MQECKSPSVEIWWFYYGDVICADPVEVENGLSKELTDYDKDFYYTLPPIL